MSACATWVGLLFGARRQSPKRGSQVSAGERKTAGFQKAWMRREKKLRYDRDRIANERPDAESGAT